MYFSYRPYVYNQHTHAIRGKKAAAKTYLIASTLCKTIGSFKKIYGKESNWEPNGENVRNNDKVWPKRNFLFPRLQFNTRTINTQFRIMKIAKSFEQTESRLESPTRGYIWLRNFVNQDYTRLYNFLVCN